MKKQLKTLGAVALASLTAVGLASCKGQETTTPNPDQNNNGGQTQQPTYDGVVKSYVASDFAKRTEILGILEKYAIDHNMTGITLFEDGGYVRYDDSIKLRTQGYVNGYGLGALSEGEIVKPLRKPAKPEYSMYYHTFNTNEVNTINMMNDKGSEVADFIPFVTSSYFDNRLTENNDRYEWFGVLAQNRPDGKVKLPQALNAGSNGLATKYRIEVKTGKDGFKYNTLSTKYGQFKGREVKLEDYITPYKIYYTQAYGMARGSENLTGPGSYKGTSEYYQNSKAGFSQADFDKIGIKPVREGGKEYLEFEFNIPCSPFYAMYYSSSAMFTPLPEDFVTALGGGDFAKGVKVYGNRTPELSPVDTFLSTGPYCIEKWDEQEIVFKKNELYNLQGENRWKMEGIHFAILKAAKNDPLAAWNEYKLGKLSSVGVPKAHLQEEKNKPNTYLSKAGTTTKMNVNSLDQETWNKLFGPNGTTSQNPESEIYQCEPALSNKDFVKALQTSINRLEFADKCGKVPSNDFFGSSYLSDPEKGILYNSTEAHKKAKASLNNGTDEYGYSFEIAKTLFKKATDDLVAQGKYKAGDTITLDLVWQYQVVLELYGKDVQAYWKKAFDESGSQLKLAFNDIVVAEWSDAYYKYMIPCKYDIALGGINGNPLNPLNFLDTLFSNQESGFTLSWGTDTSVVDPELTYDGLQWSFESLYKAAEFGGYFENGVLVDPYKVQLKETKKNADGSVDLTFDVQVIKGVKDLQCDLVTKATLLSSVKVDEKNTKNQADQVDLVVNGNTVTAHLSKELVDKHSKGTLGYSISLGFNVSLCDIASDPQVNVALDFSK